MTPHPLKQEILRKAAELGFSYAGIAAKSALDARKVELARWLDSERPAGLDYMRRFGDRHAQMLAGLPEIRSLIVLAAQYGEPEASGAPGPDAGRVARYARGRDYHRAIEKRLKKLQAFIREKAGNGVTLRSVIDTGPVLERAVAEAAGLGFFGKNTLLIRPNGGSFFFLAVMLTDLELEPDEAKPWDCGSCTLCLEACPTGALEPHRLDAGLCISYQTIENRGPVPEQLRPKLGSHLFGCDICQEVCPYNKRPPQDLVWPEFQAPAGAGAQLPLSQLLRIRTDKEFARRFAGTPIMRAKRAGMVRNAAIAAGNSGNPELIPLLQEAVQTDESELVRQHAAWAISQLQQTPDR